MNEFSKIFLRKGIAVFVQVCHYCGVQTLRGNRTDDTKYINTACYIVQVEETWGNEEDALISR